MENKYCIVRAAAAGVFFGRVKTFEPANRLVVLEDARRLWYWSGASECIQLAAEGVKDPNNCKFTMSVAELTVLNVAEVIPCTDKAIEILQKVAPWKS